VLALVIVVALPLLTMTEVPLDVDLLTLVVVPVLVVETVVVNGLDSVSFEHKVSETIQQGLSF